MSLGLHLVENIRDVLEALVDGLRHVFDVGLLGIFFDLVKLLELVACDYHVVFLGPVSDHHDLVVERHQPNNSLRVFLLHLGKLVFDGGQHALLSRHVGLIFVVPEVRVFLVLIPGLNELLQHIVFILRYPVLEVHLPLDFLRHVHRPADINAQNYRNVLLFIRQDNLGLVLYLLSALQHVYDIFFFGYFFWLDLDDVWVLAELTDPNLIPFLDIDRLDQIFFFHGLHFLVLGQFHLHLLFFLVVSFVGLLFVLLDLLLYVIRQLLLDYHLLGLWCLVLVFLALWHLQILLARDHVRILIYAGMALLAENWVSHGQVLLIVFEEVELDYDDIRIDFFVAVVLHDWMWLAVNFILAGIHCLEGLDLLLQFLLLLPLFLASHVTEITSFLHGNWNSQNRSLVGWPKRLRFLSYKNIVLT